MSRRELDPTTFCEACRSLYRSAGRIGICDHDFPGRPLRRFWTRLEELAEDPSRVRVALCRAATFDEAHRTLQSRRVSLFVTWWHFDKVDALERGQRAEVELERMPSAYDEYASEPGGRLLRSALEEAGKETT